MFTSLSRCTSSKKIRITLSYHPSNATKPHSRATDFPFAELAVPDRVRVVTVIRDGAVLSTAEIDRLRADDMVLVLTPPALSLVVDRFFSRRFKSTAAHLRREHGDFFVDGGSSVASLVRAYDLPLKAPVPGLTVNRLLKDRIGPTVGRGDRLRIGPVDLIVVDMIGPDIKEVGVRLRLEDSEPANWRRRLSPVLARLPVPGLRRRLGRWLGRDTL